MGDNYELKVRKGQAFNLAVADAVQRGKQDDTKYIYQRFIRYFELGALLQEATIEELREALGE